MKNKKNASDLRSVTLFRIMPSSSPVSSTSSSLFRRTVQKFLRIIPSLLVMLFVVSLVFVTLMQIAVIHSNRNKLLGYQSSPSTRNFFPEPSSLQLSDDNASRTSSSSSSRFIYTASGARFSRQEVLKALNYSNLENMALHPRILKGITVRAPTPSSSSATNKGKNKDTLRIEAMLDRSLSSRDHNVKMLQNFVNSARIKQMIRSLQENGMLDVPVVPQHPSSLPSKKSFQYDYHSNDTLEFEDRDENNSEIHNELLSWHPETSSPRTTSSQNRHDQIINSFYGSVESKFEQRNAIMPFKQRHNDHQLGSDRKQEERPQDVIREVEEAGQQSNPQLLDSLRKSTYDSPTNNHSVSKFSRSSHHQNGEEEGTTDGTQSLLVVKSDIKVDGIFPEPQVMMMTSTAEKRRQEAEKEPFLVRTTGRDDTEGIIRGSNNAFHSRLDGRKKINSQRDSQQEASPARGSHLTLSQSTSSSRHQDHQPFNLHHPDVDVSPLNELHSRGKEDRSPSLRVEGEQNYTSLINLQNTTRTFSSRSAASTQEPSSSNPLEHPFQKGQDNSSHEVSMVVDPSIRQEKKSLEKSSSLFERLYVDQNLGVNRPRHSMEDRSGKGLLDDKILRNNKSLCPLVPVGLIGRIQIELQPEIGESMKHIVDMNPQVRAGGSFCPASCYSRHRVAIIIPYRDRLEHLQLLLYHLHPVLQRQQLEYTLYVVEQAGNDTFNKGVLMNAGAREALKDNDFHCFIFHDVDLIPEDDRNLYSCPSAPRHMSYGVDKFNYT